MNRYLSLLALPLAGCGFFGGSKFDGTWLFKFDPNQDVSGSCAEDDTGGMETTYTGTQNMLVDIYRSATGDLVIGFDGNVLTGTPEGNTFTVKWETSLQADTWSETSRYTLDGTLEGGVLSGKLTYFQEEAAGDQNENCTLSTTYTAEKVVSKDDSYVE